MWPASPHTALTISADEHAACVADILSQHATRREYGLGTVCSKSCD